MELKLKVLVGSNVGQEIKVAGPKFFIGTQRTVTFVRSDLISRHHCVLIVEEKLVAVRDFGSKNGTLVNSERVGAEREIKNGDHLTIGPLQFEAVITESAPAKKRPPVTSVKEAAERVASSSTEFEMDEDVNKWLAGGEPAKKEKEALTREIQHPSETEEVIIGAAETAVVPKPDMDNGANKKTVEPKSPGKLPTGNAAGAKDSFSAAADMLRKIRKR